MLDARQWRGSLRDGANQHQHQHWQRGPASNTVASARGRAARPAAVTVRVSDVRQQRQRHRANDVDRDRGEPGCRRAALQPRPEQAPQERQGERARLAPAAVGGPVQRLRGSQGIPVALDARGQQFGAENRARRATGALAAPRGLFDERGKTQGDAGVNNNKNLAASGGDCSQLFIFKYELCQVTNSTKNERKMSDAFWKNQDDDDNDVEEVTKPEGVLKKRKESEEEGGGGGGGGGGGSSGERPEKRRANTFRDSLIVADKEMVDGIAREYAANEAEAAEKLLKLKDWRYFSLDNAVANESVAKFLFTLNNTQTYQWITDAMEDSQFERFFRQLKLAPNTMRITNAALWRTNSALMNLVLARFRLTPELGFAIRRYFHVAAAAPLSTGESNLKKFQREIFAELSKQDDAMKIVRLFDDENLSQQAKKLIIAYSDKAARVAICLTNKAMAEFCRHIRNQIAEIRFFAMFGSDPDPVKAARRLEEVRAKKVPFFGGGNDKPELGWIWLSQEWADFYRAAVAARELAPVFGDDNLSRNDLTGLLFDNFGWREGLRRAALRSRPPVIVTPDDRKFRTARMLMWFLHTSNPPATRATDIIMKEIFGAYGGASYNEMTVDDFINADGTIFDGTLFIAAVARFRNGPPIAFLIYDRFSQELVELAYEQLNDADDWFQFCTAFGLLVAKNGYIALELLVRNDVTLLMKEQLKPVFLRFLREYVAGSVYAKYEIIQRMLRRHATDAVDLWINAVENYASNHADGERGFDLAYDVISFLFSESVEGSANETLLQPYANMVSRDLIPFASPSYVVSLYEKDSESIENWNGNLRSLRPKAIAGLRRQRARHNLDALLDAVVRRNLPEHVEFRVNIEKKIAEFAPPTPAGVN